MLAGLGIIFHDLHLTGRVFLVFGRGVEMARSRAGFELDLVTHG